MRALARKCRQTGRVGFVPTMGYLHDGHLSLIRTARKHCETVIVSVFVNPTQFGPSEDLDCYPRDLEGDAEKISAAGADVLFAPGLDDIYDGGESVQVSLPYLSGRLCGRTRPTHFSGVCQVVLKLLNIVSCNVAVFGEKDYQQLSVIRRMVVDLFLDVEIIGAPIVREQDGLAMSSRNVYLSDNHRALAPSLFRTLQFLKRAVGNGERRVDRLMSIGRDLLAETPEIDLEYLEIVEANTLEMVETIEANVPLRALIAARLGQTRLIDNLALT